MTESAGYRCTLSLDELPARTDQVQRLIDGLQSRERDERRVRLRFDPSLSGVVDAFVRDESACCAFYDFAVEERADAVQLTVEAPAGAEPLLESLYAAFEPGRRGHTDTPSDRQGG